ncbi:unnamed protein product [Periconia digitata]|uniref:Uncharacterized protein n=1 Tax=Periconia digitata TaxID=1303443 RepID=A0A9W4UQF1_9PLEO|nr:unnamed protein product [Periconia digitata]
MMSLRVFLSSNQSIAQDCIYRHAIGGGSSCYDSTDSDMMFYLFFALGLLVILAPLIVAFMAYVLNVIGFGPLGPIGGKHISIEQNHVSLSKPEVLTIRRLICSMVAVILRRVRPPRLSLLNSSVARHEAALAL